jgi:hypothetical protein
MIANKRLQSHPQDWSDCEIGVVQKFPHAHVQARCAASAKEYAKTCSERGLIAAHFRPRASATSAEADLCAVLTTLLSALSGAVLPPLHRSIDRQGVVK